MDGFRALLEEWLARTDSTQAGLARQSGVPQNVISRWLGRAPTTPTTRNLAKLAPVIGVPYEALMRMCGYLPGEPSEPRGEVDARRQAARDQLDRWLAAVGPDYEDFFWNDLKSRAESNVRFINEVRTAVSTDDDARDSNAVGDGHSRRADATRAKLERARRAAATSTAKGTVRHQLQRTGRGAGRAFDALAFSETPASVAAA